MGSSDEKTGRSIGLYTNDFTALVCKECSVDEQAASVNNVFIFNLYSQTFVVIRKNPCMILALDHLNQFPV